MCTVDDIVRQVGREQLRECLGVADTSISNAVSSGKFPASWRDVVEDLVGPLGIDVQNRAFKKLFNMKPVKRVARGEAA